jgi:hypothetical protein
MSMPHIFIHPLGGHGTRQQIIACVIFALTGPILALDYWQNGGSITFVGPVPLFVLFIVACLGGAVSFARFVGRGWWLAIIPGMLGGGGAFGLHFWWTTWMEKQEMDSAESVGVACIGTLPGIFLCWALFKLFRPREKADGGDHSAGAILTNDSSQRAP